MEYMYSFVIFLYLLVQNKEISLLFALTVQYDRCC